jgi:hypothetical protein
MKRRQFFTMATATGAAAHGFPQTQSTQPAPQAGATPDSQRPLPERLLLKDYRPESINRIPRSELKNALRAFRKARGTA